MIRRLILLALAVAVAAPLAACGRKGNPIAPPGTSFPRQYPHTPFPGEAGGAEAAADEFEPPAVRAPAPQFRLKHPEAEKAPVSQ